MLNKELLMAVGKGVDPILSIYFTPGNTANATVYIRLPSEKVIQVTDQGTPMKTFKFSEISLTSYITIRYNEYLTNFILKNLVDVTNTARAPEIGFKSLSIEDVTQPASLVIE